MPAECNSTWLAFFCPGRDCACGAVAVNSQTLTLVTGDSSEVMQLLATNNFDALLLDNWMPDLNGIELCRLVRSVDQKLPIFFCSGAATDADKKVAFAAGAQAYLVKPLTLTNSL